MKTFGPKKSTNQKLQTEVDNTVNIDGYVQGNVADGNTSTDNPVVQGGIYKSDPTDNTLEDGYVGEILINEQRMQITEDRTYDSPSDANKYIPVFISQDRYSFENLSGSQEDSDDTLNYYIDMQGYSFFSLQYIPSGDGYKTLTVHASNEDVSDITSATYTDVTNDWFNSASFTTESWLERDTVVSTKYLKIDVAVTGLSGGDTASWDLFLNKKGA